jgi:hypothetical protein
MESMFSRSFWQYFKYALLRKFSFILITWLFVFWTIGTALYAMCILIGIINRYASLNKITLSFAIISLIIVLSWTLGAEYRGFCLIRQHERELSSLINKNKNEIYETINHINEEHFW